MSEWIERIKNTAKSDKKTIVLPEGYDPRVIEAAKKVIDERIAEIVILGDPDKIDNHPIPEEYWEDTVRREFRSMHQTFKPPQCNDRAFAKLL